jgi:acyl-CoA synthetase (NDP forming)
VKDYHERQYADTQTAAAEKDSQLSSSENGQVTSAAGPQLPSTAGGHHDDDRLEIAKDGLGLILERSDKQLVTGSKHISVILCLCSRDFLNFPMYILYTVHT